MRAPVVYVWIRVLEPQTASKALNTHDLVRDGKHCQWSKYNAERVGNIECMEPYIACLVPAAQGLNADS